MHCEKDKQTLFDWVQTSDGCCDVTLVQRSSHHLFCWDYYWEHISTARERTLVGQIWWQLRSGCHIQLQEMTHIRRCVLEFLPSLTMVGVSSMNCCGVTEVTMHCSELTTHLLSSELLSHWDLREHLFSTVHQPHSGNEPSPVHSSHVLASEHVSSGCRNTW